MPGPAYAPFNVFICYAREDRSALEQLMGHLAVFERNGAVRFWYDREITGGKDWDEEIRFNLKTADIVLLLISPDFFKSDYIHSVELTEALQRDRDKEALVVPVILKKCLWYKHPELARLQALPAEAKPVFDRAHWPDPNDGFFDVAEGFGRILEDPVTEERRQRKAARQEAEAAAEPHAQKRSREQKEDALRKREAESADQKRRVEEAAGLGLEPEMVFVQGGTFTMGWLNKERDGEGFDYENPAHKVTVRDFYIGRTAVTVAEFKKFIEDSGYKTDAEKQGSSLIWTGSEFEDKKGVNWLCDVSGEIRKENEYNHPVIHVSWNDAKAYSQWLAQKTGQYYRLPTEAEREYAARGGKLGMGYLYSGSNNIDEVAWYSRNSGQNTHPVGMKKPNELGLYDMSGNVWEWCEDDWHGNYKGAPTDGSAWVASQGASYRVLRGGGWYNDPLGCRAACRDYDAPAYRNYYVGFRLAL